MIYNKLTFEEALELYAEKFNDNVPLFQMTQYTDEEVLNLVCKALKTGKPIKVETRLGEYY